MNNNVCTLSDVRNETTNQPHNPEIQEGRYERIILAYLLRDKKYIEMAKQYDLRAHWFEHKELRQIFRLIQSHYTATQEVLSKSVYMDMVSSNPGIDAAEIPSYDSFYHVISSSIRDERDCAYYFNEFRKEGINQDICNSFSKYVSEKKETGCEEAFEKLMYELRRVPGAGVKCSWKSLADYSGVTFAETPFLVEELCPSGGAPSI